MEKRGSAGNGPEPRIVHESAIPNSRRLHRPFAGHPNVGVAFVLARQNVVCDRSFDRRNMVFEEIAELVRITTDTVDGLVMAAPKQFRVVRDFDATMIA